VEPERLEKGRRAILPSDYALKEPKELAGTVEQAYFLSDATFLHPPMHPLDPGKRF